MLLPEHEIKYEETAEGWVAWTPLLSSIKGTGKTRQKAGRALRRELRRYLVALRDRGEELPEPFASDARRKRSIAIAVVLAIAILPPLVVGVFSPPQPLKAEVVDPELYHALKPGLTQEAVKKLLGEKDLEVIAPTSIDIDRIRFLGLPPSRVETVYRYRKTDIAQTLDIYFDFAQRLVGKILYEQPEQAP